MKVVITSIISKIFMKISLYSKFVSKNSAHVMDAIREGLQKLGHTITEHNDTAEMAVICSTLWLGRMMPNKNIFKRYRESGRNILVYDSGAILRGQTWKLGLNAINAEGYFGPKGNDMKRRKLLGIKDIPWVKRKGSLLICTQHTRSQQWHDMPAMQNWCKQVIHSAKRAGWQNIIVRPHPRSMFATHSFRNDGARVMLPVKLGDDVYDFDKALNGAAAVVSFSSNPGLTAALRGVPVFVSNRSLAYDVRCGEIGNLEVKDYPNKEQWLNDFVYTEWTVDELKTGDPIARLLNT